MSDGDAAETSQRTKCRLHQKGDRKKCLIEFGGLALEEQDRLFAALNFLHAENSISVVIHVGAQGADLMAGAWRAQSHLPMLQVNARWKELGGSAGSIRNERILDHCAPEQVIAFPAGSGTSNMVT